VKERAEMRKEECDHQIAFQQTALQMEETYATQDADQVELNGKADEGPIRLQHVECYPEKTGSTQ
jgi:hypothetical protein